jgi:hypothetical protein
MNTTAIKNFAQRARRDFRKLVTDKAHALGIGKKDIAKATEKGDALIIHGQAFPVSVKRQRDELIAVVQQQGFDHVVDSMAYTLFNRLCALRFMEVHDYLPQRVLSAKDGGDVPDILKNAVDVAEKLFSDPKERKSVKELKLAGTKDQELFKRLIHAQCNTLASSMPFLFEKQQDYSELLMPDNLLHSDSVVRDMVKSIEEADWQEIEIIGWLYQFYISERKDEVMGSVVEKDDIPAATQLFTPKWIVRYMVENSLGRLWLESHPESPLKAKMIYFIKNPDDGKAPPSRRLDTPDEIKCMDNACGSGHILVYKFDLLYEMYVECGYPKTEIPAMILKNNLYGLDIDERAVQLASFALTMKARAKDTRFFEKGVFPNVIAIQESNDLDLDVMFSMGLRNTSDRSPFDVPNTFLADPGMLPVQNRQFNRQQKDFQKVKALFGSLVESFIDAKNFGSLLIVSDSLASQLPLLKNEMSHFTESAQLFDQRSMRLLCDLTRQAEVLAMKVNICVTNPPYMGSKFHNDKLKAFIGRTFLEEQQDTYTCFMSRCKTMVTEGGLYALVTLPSWMALPTFSQFRNSLLRESTLLTLIDNGRGVWGPDYGSCAFVLAKSNIPNYLTQFARLFLRRGEVSRNEEIEQRFFEKQCVSITKEELLTIPGSPIAYWTTPITRKAFTSYPPVASIGEAKNGMTTGDNELFLRQWFEVIWSRVDVNRRPNCVSANSDNPWVPYSKGGEFRKWYGNSELIIYWGSNGERLRANKPKTILRNPQYYFRPAITWSLTSMLGFGARCRKPGFAFDVNGMSLFVDDGDRAYVLAFLNSYVARQFLEILNPTIAFQAGDIGRLPFLKSVKGVAGNSDLCRRLAEADWDNYETSWDFTSLPLLRKDIKNITLEHSWKSFSVYCTDNIKRLQQLETETNRLFIKAYGLQDELSPVVPEDQITLARADVEKDIKAFISYAIGCMMGRYSLSRPGLQFAGGAWDETTFGGAKFKPDHDGILPILNDAYFEDDPTERLAEFLIVTFGKEKLNENLQFIAQTLGIKGNESPRDTIRRYLSETFFRDHLRTYKKRPIYWLFTSGKERAFQALVYMHRYTPATLSRMRTSYLHELQNKLNARVDEIQRTIDEATSTAQSNRLNKDLIRVKKQQAELLAFDEKLNNIASKKIAIDLDDGVKHNYGLFGDLLAEVKTVCGKDEE